MNEMLIPFGNRDNWIIWAVGRSFKAKKRQHFVDPIYLQKQSTPKSALENG